MLAHLQGFLEGFIFCPPTEGSLEMGMKLEGETGRTVGLNWPKEYFIQCHAPQFKAEAWREVFSKVTVAQRVEGDG